LLGKTQAQQPDFGGFFVEHARKPAGLIPFVGVGLDLLFDKAAHHLTIGLVFGGVEWACHSLRSLLLEQHDRIL
jgi:hypothetical protein